MISDLGTMIKTGTGALADDAMSGSILKLLAENGFADKVSNGISSGHNYSIIHNAPSTEFILIDSWTDGSEMRKSYHAFSIKSLQKKNQEQSAPAMFVPEPEHPLLIMLRELDSEVDQLLTMTARFA